ncbi:MAG TPA: hypothetical protein DIW43_06515 [Spongiibacteraceae bacterium]|nr:hypothetical protein [Spongiibacteraceae bacterium]MBN51733.1 hypothetical protein [Spongiibacteraceae bacterium]HCS27087.1 hypothetical protein [Spongiibacteraceae bacterium]|tara:strand:+ start:807 stop:1766 length:960 start_codon:yes stop_codon:yes gene_type:complete
MHRKLTKSRLLLQNPYAYVTDDGFEYTDPTALQATKSPEKPPALIPAARKSEEISRSRYVLQNQYAHLMGDGSYEAANTNSRVDDIFMSAIPQRKKENYSKKDIASLVNRIHNILLKNKDAIFHSNVPNSPSDLLSPTIVLNHMGYQCETHGSLGLLESGNNRSKVAGMLDKKSNKVLISLEFPRHMQNFTAAHELGHVLLHSETGLHRDIAVDGSKKRTGQELDADIFASLLLMPEAYVAKHFKLKFNSDCFRLTPENIHMLGAINSPEKIKSLRDLSRTLARCKTFNQESSPSLAELFNVSIEAMAIRIEELGLAKY